MRKNRVPLMDAEIELALYCCSGNSSASARMLNCSQSYVAKYIHGERAKGREIGRRGAGRPKSDSLPLESLVCTALEMSVDHPMARKYCTRDPKRSPEFDELCRQMALDLGIAA